MRESVEFKEFYDRKLKPVLQKYEEIRKKKKREFINSIISICILTAFAGAVIFVIFRSFDYVGLLGTVALFFCAKFYTKLSRSYKEDSKREIMNKIIKFISPKLSYHPKDRVAEGLFRASKLFSKEHKDYKGEDLVKGCYGKTKLQFSEISASYQPVKKGKDGTWVSVFEGIFFVADFNKNFNGYTLVLPDRAQKMFGSLGQNFQELSKKGQLIKLEDSEFEKLFVVYGNDQVEARYILTPSLMQRIKEFKVKANTEVRISFVDSKVFVAIFCYLNLFEFSFFKSIINYEKIEEYYDYLALAVSIVDELNLNQRIWSKQ